MCVKIHPCDKKDKGGCEQTCTKYGDNAKCECDSGKVLNQDGKTCGIFSFL